MITKAVESKLKNVIEQEAKTYIANAREQIRKALESATLSLLGLERSTHRGYEIDHCNGRNSVLIDAFRAVALEEATKIAMNYKPSDEDLVGYRAAFEKEMRERMRWALQDLARAKAKMIADEVTETVKLNVKQAVESVFSEENK